MLDSLHFTSVVILIFQWVDFILPMTMYFSALLLYSYSYFLSIDCLFSRITICSRFFLIEPWVTIICGSCSFEFPLFHLPYNSDIVYYIFAQFPFNAFKCVIPILNTFWMLFSYETSIQFVSTLPKVSLSVDKILPLVFLKIIQPESKN